jgi:hypothetical protein
VFGTFAEPSLAMLARIFRHIFDRTLRTAEIREYAFHRRSDGGI